MKEDGNGEDENKEIDEQKEERESGFEALSVSVEPEIDQNMYYDDSDFDLSVEEVQMSDEEGKMDEGTDQVRKNEGNEEDDETPVEVQVVFSEEKYEEDETRGPLAWSGITDETLFQ
jgi:hypothetical protein